MSPSAIALSLQDPQPRRPAPDVITIDSDDDEPTWPRAPKEEDEFDEDLRRVLELSKTEVSASQSSKTTLTSLPAAPPPTQAAKNGPKEATTPNSAPPAAAGKLSERAQMEQERLARLRQRRPDLVPDVTSAPPMQSKRSRTASSGSDTEDDELQPATKRQRNPHFNTRSSVDANTRRRSVPPQEPMFWDGELRQTANPLVEPAKDTRSVFRLSEIIGKVSCVLLQPRFAPAVSITALLLTACSTEVRDSICDLRCILC
jgi:tyrosyl-DNA phosphodiesterase-1